MEGEEKRAEKTERSLSKTIEKSRSKTPSARKDRNDEDDVRKAIIEKKKNEKQKEKSRTFSF